MLALARLIYSAGSVARKLWRRGGAVGLEYTRSSSGSTSETGEARLEHAVKQEVPDAGSLVDLLETGLAVRCRRYPDTRTNWPLDMPGLVPLR